MTSKIGTTDYLQAVTMMIEISTVWSTWADLISNQVELAWSTNSYYLAR